MAKRHHRSTPTYHLDLRDEYSEKIFNEEIQRGAVAIMCMLARKAKKLSPAKLAKAAGLKPGSIERLESGDIELSVLDLHRVVAALGKNLIIEFL